MVALRWILLDVHIVSFFLLVFMICMTMFRWQSPKFNITIIIDGIVCAIFDPWLLIIIMFPGMYHRMFIILMLIPVIAFYDLRAAAMALLSGLAGMLLGFWEKEWERSHDRRDNEAERFYDTESLKNDLLAATTKIEQMTVVSERARIAREIHDNAGHEIVAAYISFQTVREIMDEPENFNQALVLYETALGRLENGVNKIREAVHNLAPVTMLGVEALKIKCENMPQDKIKDGVSFKSFGDSSKIPIHVWTVLEACLSESLTNIIRHAEPSFVNVNLDVSTRIIRLFVENDGTKNKSKHAKPGSGLRNIRHRVTALGGSLTNDFVPGGIFRVVCVIPIV